MRVRPARVGRVGVIGAPSRRPPSSPPQSHPEDAANLSHLVARGGRNRGHRPHEMAPLSVFKTGSPLKPNGW
jgi:hypothetical protein